MNITKLLFCFLSATFLCGAGCFGYKRPNPLQGWKGGQSAFDGCPFAKTICDDYQHYINSLSKDDRAGIDKFSVHFYEDGRGQRAVTIQVLKSNSRREHVLIYDPNNKRIKVIRYTSGRFVS